MCAMSKMWPLPVPIRVATTLSARPGAVADTLWTLAPRFSSSALKIAPMAFTPVASLVPESICTSSRKSARAFGSHIPAAVRTRPSGRA